MIVKIKYLITASLVGIGAATIVFCVSELIGLAQDGKILGMSYMIVGGISGFIATFTLLR